MAFRYDRFLLLAGALTCPGVLVAQVPTTVPDGATLADQTESAAFCEFLSDRTHGSLEFGVIVGRPPFSLEATQAVNLIGRGNLRLEIIGVPIITSFDLGTDASTRGQRNALHVGVDVGRLRELVQLRDAQRLDAARGRRDSLQNALSDELHRARMVPIEARGFVLDTRSDTMSSQPPASTLDSLVAPMAPEESAPVPAITSTAPTISPPAPATRDRTQKELAAAEKTHAQAEALVNMDLDRSVAGRFLMGLRRAELGTLTPTGSEFLLNGLSLQGFGVEWASERLFFSFDQGRCLDDSWRSATLSSERLRRLQESLFLIDASALDPRRLTALRTGIGTPEGTHLHIGLLRGRRSGMAYGAEGPLLEEPSTMINHVIELDAAVAIKYHHRARFVVARSVNRIDYGETAGEVEPGLLSTGDARFAAGMLQWRSELPKARATVDVTGRTIGAGFHSMGLAFVRSGSRSVDGMISKDIGRLRLRLGYKKEMRQNASGEDQVGLDRYRMQSTYRLSKAVLLRASLLPMSIKGVKDSIADQRTIVYQAGINIRWRRGGTHYSLLGDCSRYDHSFLNGAVSSSMAWNANVGSEVQSARVRAALNGSVFLESGTSRPTTSNVSFELYCRLRNGIEVGTGTVINLQAPSDIGGRINYRQPLYKGFYMMLAAERWQDRKIFQSQDVGEDVLGSYTCSVLVGFSW